MAATSRRVGGDAPIRLAGLLILLALLPLALAMTCAAQSVAIEWMEADCGTSPCLVLNGYPLLPPGEPIRPPDALAAVLVPLPVASVPDSRVLNPFLEIIGAENGRGPWRELASSELASDSSRAVAWRAAVTAIQESSVIRMGDRRVRVSKVEPDLQTSYVREGFPRGGTAIFPHLIRGVLVVGTPGGEAIDSTLAIDVGGVEHGEPRYLTLQLRNAGRRPVKLLDEGGVFEARCDLNQGMHLAPGDSVRQAICMRAGLLALLGGKPTRTFSYESGGVVRPAFSLRGRRSESIPAVLAAAVGSELSAQVGYWHQYPLYRIGAGLFAAGIAFFLIVGLVSVAPVVANRLRARKGRRARAEGRPHLYEVVGRLSELAREARGGLQHGANRVSILTRQSAVHLRSLLMRYSSVVRDRLQGGVSRPGGSLRASRSSREPRELQSAGAGGEAGDGAAPHDLPVDLRRPSRPLPEKSQPEVASQSAATDPLPPADVAAPDADPEFEAELNRISMRLLETYEKTARRSLVSRETGRQDDASGK